MLADPVAEVVALAEREEPELAAALAGVPEAELAAVEAACGVRLPAIYRAFLGRMGRSTGRFLLARGYDHDFDTVTRGLPTSAYPQHLFKIAAPNDQHVSEDGTAAAYFLDLDRAADGDAPLVELEIEVDDDREPEPEHRLNFGFAAMLTRGWFRCVVFERQRWSRILRIGTSGDHVAAALRELGFTDALSPRADIYFLRRGDEDGALVMGRVGVVLELLCRSRDVFDRFPDADVSAPGPRPAYNARAFRFP